MRGPVATYHLEEWNGMPLEERFYEQDVQKVTVPDDTLSGRDFTTTWTRGENPMVGLGPKIR